MSVPCKMQKTTQNFEQTDLHAPRSLKTAETSQRDCEVSSLDCKVTSGMSYQCFVCRVPDGARLLPWEPEKDKLAPGIYVCTSCDCDFFVSEHETGSDTMPDSATAEGDASASATATLTATDATGATATATANDATATATATPMGDASDMSSPSLATGTPSSASDISDLSREIDEAVAAASPVAAAVGEAEAAALDQSADELEKELEKLLESPPKKLRTSQS